MDMVHQDPEGRGFGINYLEKKNRIVFDPTAFYMDEKFPRVHDMYFNPAPLQTATRGGKLVSEILNVVFPPGPDKGAGQLMGLLYKLNDQVAKAKQEDAR